MARPAPLGDLVVQGREAAVRALHGKSADTTRRTCVAHVQVRSRRVQRHVGWVRSLHDQLRLRQDARSRVEARDSETWKTGLVWSPVRDLSFRATVAEATRAPNINELFDP